MTSKYDIIMFKVGKAVDWMEVDMSIEENDIYMQHTIEAFLDLSVRAKTDTKLKNEKFVVEVDGKKYTTSVGDLLTSGMSVYYGEDEKQGVNLTPFEKDRVANLAAALLDEIGEFMLTMENSYA